MSNVYCEGQVSPRRLVNRTIGRLPAPNAGKIELQAAVPLLQEVKVNVSVPHGVVTTSAGLKCGGNIAPLESTAGSTTVLRVRSYGPCA